MKHPAIVLKGLLLLGLLGLASAATAQIIAVRAASQHGVTTGSLILPKPTGTLTGDQLVAAISVVPAAASVTTPAGWTSRVNATAGTTRLVVLTRVVPAGDAAVTSYTFTFGGTPHTGAAGGIVGFTGAASTAPFSANAATAPGFSHAAPSVSPTVANTHLVAIYGMAGSTGNWTSDARMVERVDVASVVTRPALSGTALLMATEPRGPTGATGTRTATVDPAGIIAAPARAALLALRPTTSSRYRIEHDGTALSCAAESVTIRTCANTACTAFLTAGATGTLTAGGNSVPFTIPAGQSSVSVAITVPTTSGPPDPEVRRLGLSGVSPTLALATNCRNGVGTVNTTTACDISTADAGFVVSVPDHDSDTVVPATISAVRRSAPGDACVPLFANVNRSLTFGSAWLNPNTGSAAVRVNGTAVATGGTPVTALPLVFDANGRAPLTVQYADAGNLRLFARYTGSAATGDTGLVMDGQDDFVARPILHLEVTSPVNPAAADATGGVFTVAGQNFATRVTARNVNAVVTPNFGRESPVEAVQLRSSLVAPVGGNNPAPVGSLGAAVNGVLSGNWRWDEVGIIGLAAHLVDNDFLGAGDLSRPAAAVLPRVGRFVPQRLAVSANAPSFAASCAAGGFGYVGQEFGFAVAPQFTVTALTAQGGVAGNYVNVGTAPAARFWRLTGNLPGRSYSNTATTAALLSRSTEGSAFAPTAVDAPPFDGSGVLQASDPLALDRLSYARPSTPEAPFLPQVTLTLPAADLTDADGRCHDPDNNGSCDAFVVTGITGPAQRWGRIAMGNAFGPDLIDLQVPMRAEFFNGSSFVLNTDDACTLLSPLTLSDPAPADALLPSETCVQDGGAPGASGLGCTVPGPLARRYAATPTAGRWNLWLRAPGAGNVGMLDLTPTVPPWLQFNWRGLGIEPPRARVGFGVFQGDRRSIHVREVY